MQVKADKEVNSEAVINFSWYETDCDTGLAAAGWLTSRAAGTARGTVLVPRSHR